MNHHLREESVDFRRIQYVWVSSFMLSWGLSVNDLWSNMLVQLYMDKVDLLWLNTKLEACVIKCSPILKTIPCRPERTVLVQMASDAVLVPDMGTENSISRSV